MRDGVLITHLEERFQSLFGDWMKAFRTPAMVQQVLGVTASSVVTQPTDRRTNNLERRPSGHEMKMWVFEKETGAGFVRSEWTPSAERAASEDDHLAAGESRSGRAARPVLRSCGCNGSCVDRVVPSLLKTTGLKGKAAHVKGMLVAFMK
jgi:hypothetical protein